MAELKIKEIKQDAVTKSITIDLQIIDGEEVIDRSYGFDPNLTTDQIKEELEKTLATYIQDKEMFLANKENDKKDQEFSHLKDELEGNTIS